MFKQIYIFIFIIIYFVIVSCGVSEFAAQKKIDKTQIAAVVTSNASLIQTQFTTIQPQVDFLFLWDNSTGSKFIDANTKQAMSILHTNISKDFNFHILLAPLNGTGNAQSKLLVSDTIGLSPAATAMVIAPSQINATISNFTLTSGTAEAGLARTNQLLNLNIANGIFRQNSYTIVVLMSTKDDYSWVPPTLTSFNPIYEPSAISYLNTNLNNLLCLRGSYTPVAPAVCPPAGINFPLNSSQLRFISLVAHNQKGGANTCGNIKYYDTNYMYKEFSKRIYQTLYNGVNQNGTSSLSLDSYNICDTANFIHIFDDINRSIKQILISHVYNFWPVASPGSLPIDPLGVKMFKNGVQIPKLTPPVTAGQNGFTFSNTITNQNMRILPTPGEPFNGYAVQLYGTAQVSYPDVVSIQTRTPAEYYGYITLSSKPVIASIQVRINGTLINKSNVNGWELLVDASGAPLYIPNQNLKINYPASFCPATSTNYCPATPALNKSGYVIKLHGTAIYSNGAQITVTYDPSA